MTAKAMEIGMRINSSNSSGLNSPDNYSINDILIMSQYLIKIIQIITNILRKGIHGTELEETQLPKVIEILYYTKTSGLMVLKQVI